MVNVDVCLFFFFSNKNYYNAHSNGMIPFVNRENAADHDYDRHRRMAIICVFGACVYVNWSELVSIQVFKLDHYIRCWQNFLAQLCSLFKYKVLQVNLQLRAVEWTLYSLLSRLQLHQYNIKTPLKCDFESNIVWIADPLAIYVFCGSTVNLDLFPVSLAHSKAIR